MTNLSGCTLLSHARRSMVLCCHASGARATSRLLPRCVACRVPDSVVMPAAQVESFFNFFSPPPIPDEDDIGDEDMQELQELLEADYELGCDPRPSPNPDLLPNPHVDAWRCALHTSSMRIRAVRRRLYGTEKVGKVGLD